MIRGTAAVLKITMRIILNKISRKRCQLSFMVKFENLKESKVTGATISSEKIMAQAKSTHTLDKKPLINESPTMIKGSVLVKMPLAVVVRPVKLVVWFSSILNLAKRKAEKTAMNTPVYSKGESILPASM